MLYVSIRLLVVSRRNVLHFLKKVLPWVMTELYDKTKCVFPLLVSFAYLKKQV